MGTDRAGIIFWSHSANRSRVPSRMSAASSVAIAGAGKDISVIAGGTGPFVPVRGFIGLVNGGAAGPPRGEIVGRLIGIEPCMW